jgi:GntR family histidine utilization transcriptional repressor
MRRGQDAALYRRIHDDIETLILSGDWPPGFRIPSEHELTVTYGCSRMTVNKAISSLVRDGYIERRRRAGSFVRQPHAQTAILEIHDIASEVASLGLPYRHEVLARAVRPANRQDCDRLGIETRPEILGVRVIHLAGYQPFCLEERVINLSTAPAAAGADLDVTPPGAWLIAHVRWNLAEHRISATAATGDVAASLALPTGSPCLAIERRTWNQDEVVTWVCLTYPAERHSLVARFSPTGS